MEVTDRIRLAFIADEPLTRALETQREYIMLETLAVDLTTAEEREMIEVDINGKTCRIAATRVEAMTTT